MDSYRLPAAQGRLAKNLAENACAILNDAEVRTLDRDVRRVLLSSFPGIEAQLGHSEDSTRWHALGIEVWVADWCRANRELATRVGLLDVTRARPRSRR